MFKRHTLTLAAKAMLGLLSAAPVMAQAASEAPTTREDRRGGGRGDPAQWRQRMIDHMKEQLGTSDDEFKAIQPKLEKVFQAQRDVMGGMGFGGRRGGGPGGPGGPGGGPGGAGAGGDQPPSAVQEKRHALQQTLENKDAKPEEIKAKLEEYRAARSQAKQDLTKAQDDLRGVLTQRQEAVLIMDGLLD